MVLPGAALTAFGCPADAQSGAAREGDQTGSILGRDGKHGKYGRGGGGVMKKERVSKNEEKYARENVGK